MRVEIQDRPPDKPSTKLHLEYKGNGVVVVDDGGWHLVHFVFDEGKVELRLDESVPSAVYRVTDRYQRMIPHTLDGASLTIGDAE